MIHTTKHANANRMIDMSQVVMIVAPVKITGAWCLQVLFKNRHTTEISYKEAGWDATQDERNRLTDRMIDDHNDLMAAFQEHIDRRSNSR